MFAFFDNPGLQLYPIQKVCLANDTFPRDFGVALIFKPK